MKKVSKGLFLNSREFSADDGGYPFGRLLCGVGDFQCNGDELENDYFDECPYVGLGVAPLGFAVLEGSVSTTSDQTGERYSTCDGTWRRPNPGELERIGRGLLPFAGETPELDRMLDEVGQKLRDLRLYNAFASAIDNMRLQTSREITPYLAAKMTGLPENEARKTFGAAVELKLFARVPVWRAGDLRYSQVAEDLSEKDSRPDAVEFLVTNSDDHAEVVGPEEITWCFSSTAKLRRALAERDGEAV